MRYFTIALLAVSFASAAAHENANANLRGAQGSSKRALAPILYPGTEGEGDDAAVVDDDMVEVVGNEPLPMELDPETDDTPNLPLPMQLGPETDDTPNLPLPMQLADNLDEDPAVDDLAAVDLELALAPDEFDAADDDDTSDVES